MVGTNLLLQEGEEKLREQELQIGYLRVTKTAEYLGTGLAGRTLRP